MGTVEIKDVQVEKSRRQLDIVAWRGNRLDMQN